MGAIIAVMAISFAIFVVIITAKVFSMDNRIKTLEEEPKVIKVYEKKPKAKPTKTIVELRADMTKTVEKIITQLEDKNTPAYVNAKKNLANMLKRLEEENTWRSYNSLKGYIKYLRNRDMVKYYE